ncbi:LuxR C-terminal-related transcriptional regulator [Flavitalea sp. BT771]|uniref:response regulator n=1 Tax=Flavitalea sp. BT771 TaxID=3063329 RepID=UPI0026E30164|nr:LuxR C-terminal-related transcriptional regulator [Flavitalea sp. BT771]MDO6433307.1 LuxR C-terminal-related transcriptional regulator [Flavitalea sp. BT771]MDV6222788.1 LuxR C-terminal-related transcriptional regulator [Flavitalea sp. BT771]
MERRILMAEDHALLRWSIKAICSREGIPHLDEVQTCRELMQALNSVDYTHLIMDITLGDGNALTLLPGIFEEFLTLKVLVYSSQPARLYDEFLWQRYGVQYISKAEQETETIQKLLAFLKGTEVNQRESTDPEVTPFSGLTFKEKQVLQYLLKGWAPARIAGTLKTKASTVRVQKKSILEKTKTKNLLELKDLANLHKL